MGSPLSYFRTTVRPLSFSRNSGGTWSPKGGLFPFSSFLPDGEVTLDLSADFGDSFSYDPRDGKLRMSEPDSLPGCSATDPFSFRREGREASLPSFLMARSEPDSFIRSLPRVRSFDNTGSAERLMAEDFSPSGALIFSLALKLFETLLKFSRERTRWAFVAISPWRSIDGRISGCMDLSEIFPILLILVWSSATSVSLRFWSWSLWTTVRVREL